MTPEAIQRKIYLMNIKQYLATLNALILPDVHKEELCTIDETHSLLEQFPYANYELNSFELSFEKKGEVAFRSFWARLLDLYNGELLVWIKGNRECGTYRLQSLECIDLGFDFGVANGGPLSLTSLDLNEMVMLDWSYEDEKKVLSIEYQGRLWSKCDPKEYLILAGYIGGLKLSIDELIQEISSKDRQKRLWFSNGKSQSSPIELYCKLFDDMDFVSYINSTDTNLNADRRKIGQQLIEALNQYASDGDILYNTEEVFNDLEWDEIRKIAQRYLGV